MGSLCRYEKLEGDIHKFTFTTGTREAVDEWVKEMNQVYLAEGLDLSLGTMRIMVDHSQAGMLPLSYTIKVLDRWLKTMPERRPSRIAAIYGKNVLLSLMDAFTRMLQLQHELVRLFPSEQSAEAQAWLVKESSARQARR